MPEYTLLGTDDGLEYTIPEEEPITTIPEEELITTIPEEELITTIPEEELVTTIPEEELITTIPEEELITTIPEEELITLDGAIHGTLLLTTITLLTTPDGEATTTPALTTNLRIVPVEAVSARELFWGSCGG